MHKNKTHQNILAINPGWRYLGIAVFCDSELREWRLKMLKTRGPKAKMAKVNGILSAFMECYEPDILAIKKLHPSRSSPNLKIMVSGIKASCRRKKIKVISRSIGELESVFSSGEKINKKELARIMASRYPVLERELNREGRNRNPYFIRLFEAVALGAACDRQLNNKS